LFDVDLYHIPIKIIIPYPFEQDVLGKHLPWMQEELLEYFEFEARQRHSALAAMYNVAAGI